MTVAITMQRQSTGMAAASLTTTTAAAAAVGANSTPTMVVRPTLPDRRVTAATIEDAYVRFILYCNPAVPLSTDTTALREAFRSPPKSGGKSFSTFTLFELIKQLDNKSIKTWAELALRLGVDPPDQDKGQSSQKIQQYAVRLKRWMHSMHVDAFFEYLMDIPHPYWTQIPQDPNPVSEFGRDGVAAEDDMALRALLPQIRPRRGRRKPEDDGLSKSPSQRPRLDSPPNAETFHALRNDTMEAWTAHPDGRTTFSFSALDVNNLGLTPNQGAGQHWGTMDMAQTPLMAYPQSAITPSTRNPFWNDEPRSAITPSKPKSLHRRHGAKVVSSAWRSTGIGGIRKKRRGRPPLSLSTTDGPFSAFPADTVSLKSNTPENDGCRSAATTGSISAPPPVPTANMSSTIPTPISSTRSPSIPANMSLQNLPTQASRPGKPSRLSLQVPQRQGGTVVRLATPPMVTVNGQTTDANAAGDTMDLGHAGQHMDLDSQPMNLNAHGGFAQNIFALEPSSMSGMYQVQAQAHHQVAPPPTVTAPQINFDVEEDRTNVDDLLAFFLQELLAAHWTDANDNEIPACDLDEARAIVNTLLDSIHKSSPNTETFLINVSALAGGKLLMTTSNLRVKRVEEGPDYTRYTCVWELRLGFRRGYYSTTVTVPHSSWKSDAAKAAEADKDAEADEDDDASHENSEDGGEEDGSAAATAAGGSMWQKKYRELLAVVERKDRQIADIKKHLLDTLKEDPRTG